MKNIVLATFAVSVLTISTGCAQGADFGRRDDRGSNYDSRDQGRHQVWNKGERVPREYMRDTYVLRDWRDSGLRAPPRGTQWLRMGGQYVLVDSRSTRIMEIRLVPPPPVVERRGDRNQLWRQRYSRAYSYNDDVAYTECRGRPDPAGVLAGAFLGAILGNAAAGRGDRGGATAAGVIAGGAIGAALTSKLDCGDRSYAYQSYSVAFNGGRANTVYQWKNPANQHRGEMHVLDYYDDEDDFHCAVFSQKVTIGGRIEEARGRACQQPDGNWAIID